MGDNKLRCALVYRIDSDGGQANAVQLAMYDYAAQYESHGGADEGTLYGGRDTQTGEAVAMVISNDPPGGLAGAGTIGGFKVVQSDQHQIVYGADSDGICMVVITGLNYTSRAAIQMLQELYTDFMKELGGAAKTASANSLNRKAKKVLSEKCEKYSDLRNVDKAAAVLGQVEGVKATMQDNIANMLKNTEQAESLASKSDQLNEQASVFKKKSTDLKKTMQWKNLKMTLILVGVVVIILVVILAPLISRSK